MGSLVLSGAFGVFPLAQTQAAGSEEAPVASVDAPESGVELNEQGFEPIPLEEMSDDPAAPAAHESEVASSEASATPTEPADAAAADSDEDAESEEAADQPQSVETAAGPQMSEFLRAARAPRRAPGSPLDAAFATGGTGRFKESIQWLQWADYREFQNPDGSINPHPRVPVLDYNETKTIRNERNMGDAGTLVTSCVLSNLQYLGAGTGDPTHSKGPLVATIPGTWAGDALDNLYNVGGPGKWSDGSEEWQTGLTYPKDYRNHNQMVIGLANGYAYIGNNSYENPGAEWKSGNEPTGLNSRVSVDFSCSAKLVTPDGAEKDVPLQGLVFADAEASSDRGGDDRTRYGNSNTTITNPNAQSDPAWEDEWIQADAPNVKSWRLLDRLRSADCKDTKGGPSGQVTSNAIVSSDKKKLRLMPSGEECVYQNGGGYSHPNGLGGPDAVMFMEGATSATITIQGSGYSAAALGLVIASDFGDAPKSYGYAGSLYQPLWQGGNINTTKDLFTADQATMIADKGVPSLGARIDAEGYQQFSAGADGDDTHGLEDDEDALSSAPDVPVEFLNGEKESFMLEGVACSPGKGAVRGWIDWNGNGAFDSDEQSDDQNCPAAGSVDLTFQRPATAPLDTNLVNKDATYLRLRAFETSDTSKATGPVGVTAKGEVEDYRIPLPALLKLTKTVTNDHGATAVATDWKLTANGTEFTNGKARYVDAKSYTLAEQGKTELAKKGYDWESLSCKKGNAGTTPSTDTGTSAGNPSVTVANGTLTECVFVNNDKPGSLTWNKTDEDGNLLSGSEWELVRLNDSGRQTVKDCTSGTCDGFLDKDAAEGQFKVTGLKWGDYSVKETRAPDDFIAASSSFKFTKITYDSLEATLEPVDGVKNNGIINMPKIGTVTWKKVDADNKKPLAGSVWTLTGTGLPQGGAVITDCVKVGECGTDKYADTDPAPGSFSVTNLKIGSFSLKEKAAPAGYQLLPSKHDFTITEGKLSYDFAAAFENKKQDVPPLPLTGGMSSDSFLIFGGGGLLLAAATAFAQRRRAMMRSEVRSLRNN